MLTSQPGTYSSTRTGSSFRRPAVARTSRIRAADAIAPAPSSARSTPWLPLSDTALTTHGNPTSVAARFKSPFEAPPSTTRNAGWVTPAAAHRRRCFALSVAAITASTPLWGKSQAGSHGRGQNQHRGIYGDDCVDRAGIGYGPIDASGEVARVDAYDRMTAQRQCAVATDHEIYSSLLAATSNSVTLYGRVSTATGEPPVRCPSSSPLGGTASPKSPLRC
jgi:hypothetical protein